MKLEFSMWEPCKIKLTHNALIVIFEYMDESKLFKIQACAKKFYNDIIPMTMNRLCYFTKCTNFLTYFKQAMGVFESDKWKTMEMMPIMKSLKAYVLREDTILNESDIKSADLSFIKINGNGQMNFNSHPYQKV